MKIARLVVLGVALAAGGMAAMLASRSHKTEAPAPAPVQVAPIEMTEILVAKSAMSRGTMIGGKDIGWQAWPATAVNSSFIRKDARPDAAEKFVGAIVRVPILAGQPIYDPMVVFAKGSGFMAAILPKGMRAVAIEVTAVSGAGGFILPGDHVDVLLTRSDPTMHEASGAPKFVTNTILQNVPVLAVDQATEEKAGEKVVLGRTATLELTPEQAELLALAHQQGTLALTLRGLLDSQSDVPVAEMQDGKRTAVNIVRFGIATVATR